MSRAIRNLWRWSWLVTLPISAFFLYWLDGTARSYHAFNLRRIGGDTCTLAKLGRLQLDTMSRHLEVAALSTRSVPPGPGPRQIHLSVPESALKRLDERLPLSGFNLVDGAMSGADGKTQRVKVRYRGDNLYHWAYDKKSLRVKTRNSESFDGMQSFNLVAPRTPEQLNNYFSARLGALLGLITPKAELANVTLNGRLKGLYVLTEQLDESTLRRNALEPGDVFVGDLIARSLFAGVDNQLFEHPGLWEKAAAVKGDPPGSRAPLDRLVDLLSAPRTERIQDELGKLLDMEAFGTFAALEILCSTVHVDAVHNWRLYYDAPRQRLVPIVWDLMGWHSSILPAPGQRARLDVVSSPLHVALLGNGEFLRARHVAIRRFFESGADARFLAEVERTIASLAATVAADPDVVVLGEVVRPAAVRAAMEQLAKDVARVFADVKAAYLGGRERSLRWDQNQVAGGTALALSVTSRAPVEGVVLHYDESVPGSLRGPISAELSWWLGDRRVERDVSGTVSVRGSSIEVALPLLADFVPLVKTMVPTEVQGNGLEVAPGYYELQLTGVPSLEKLVALTARGVGVPSERVVSGRDLVRAPFVGVVTPAEASPERRPIVWEGEVVLDGVTVIDNELVVQPGTTLRMKPGASLILHAPLRAVGTDERRIRVEPAVPGQAPWGTVALQGRGCAGSELRYCEIAGGSGMTGALAEYTGMVAVHDAKDIAIADCAFRDGTLSDDMVHCVYSEVGFTRCTFTNAHSDALDLDMCKASIVDCRFAKSGDDDLDLMTSRVVVVDTELGKSKGHAISAGQASRVLAVNCRLERNGTAVLSKDGSFAVVANCEIEGAAQAFDARRKNSRYGLGGELVVHKCRVAKVGKVATSDVHSRVGIHDSYVESGLPPASRHLAIGPDVDSVHERDAVSSQSLPFPAGLTDLGPAGRDAWAKVSSSTRGASPHGN